jgi:hypothetical protein
VSHSEWGENVSLRGQVRLPSGWNLEFSHDIERIGHGRENQALALDCLGALAQRGELEAGRETFGVALGGFAIDQQSDALLERQGVEIR